jgi:hypothetical protein
MLKARTESAASAFTRLRPRVRKVQVTDECVYHTNQRLRRDVVVHTRRKEVDLTAFCSLNEAHEHLAGVVLTLSTS